MTYDFVICGFVGIPLTMLIADLLLWRNSRRPAPVALPSEIQARATAAVPARAAETAAGLSSAERLAHLESLVAASAAPETAEAPPFGEGGHGDEGAELVLAVA